MKLNRFFAFFLLVIPWRVFAAGENFSAGFQVGFLQPGGFLTAFAGYRIFPKVEIEGFYGLGIFTYELGFGLHSELMDTKFAPVIEAAVTRVDCYSHTRNMCGGSSGVDVYGNLGAGLRYNRPNAVFYESSVFRIFSKTLDDDFKFGFTLMRIGQNF